MRICAVLLLLSTLSLANEPEEIAAMVPHRPWEEPMILPFGKNYLGPGIANMGAAAQVGKLKL